MTFAVQLDEDSGDITRMVYIDIDWITIYLIDYSRTTAPDIIAAGISESTEKCLNLRFGQRDNPEVSQDFVHLPSVVCESSLTDSTFLDEVE